VVVRRWLQEFKHGNTYVYAWHAACGGLGWTLHLYYFHCCIFIRKVYVLMTPILFSFGLYLMYTHTLIPYLRWWHMLRAP
jgi:hypothetical protein